MLPSPDDRPTVSVAEAAGYLGVSRASAYEGVRNGSIPSIRIGRRLLVPTAPLRLMLGMSETTVPALPQPSFRAGADRDEEGGHP